MPNGKANMQGSINHNNKCQGLPGATVHPGHIFVTDSALHISQSHFAIKTDLAILSTCMRIYDMGSLIRGKGAAFAGISLLF
jgi:hypothetical protein